MISIKEAFRNIKRILDDQMQDAPLCVWWTNDSKGCVCYPLKKEEKYLNET